MGQRADRHGCRLGKIVGVINLDLVDAADRDLGEHAVSVTHDVDVVGDRASVEGLQDREWWLRIEHLDLADIRILN